MKTKNCISMSYHGYMTCKKMLDLQVLVPDLILLLFFIFINLIGMLRLRTCSAEDSRLKMLAEQLNIKLGIIRLEGTFKMICSVSLLKKWPSYAVRENLEIK